MKQSKKNETQKEKTTKQTQKEVEQTSKENKEKISFKVPKIAWFGIAWFLIAFIGVWLNTSINITDSNPINNTAITTASISIMVNFIVLGAVFGTSIGQKTFKRFKHRMMFHTGKYVNTIHCTKNGTAKEVFKKVDPETKTFTIMGQKFIRNPKLLFSFEKIPTYIHREGNPDPLNIWDDKLASELSNAEMDIAMTAAQNFDLKQWINSHKQIIFIGAIIIIGVGAASAFLGFNIYQMLRDGTYKAIQCVLPPNMITPGV